MICSAYASIQQESGARASRSNQNTPSPALSFSTAAIQRPSRDELPETSPITNNPELFVTEQGDITSTMTAPATNEIGPVSVNASMGGGELTLEFPQDIDINSMLTQWDQTIGKQVPSSFLAGKTLTIASAVDIIADNAFSFTFPDCPSVHGLSPDALNYNALPLPEADATPIWQRLPLYFSEPTCRLDSVLLGIRQTSGQQMTPSSELDHTESFPSVASLLNPAEASVNTPISTAIGHHGRMTLRVGTLPEKIGCMYNLCLYMRVCSWLE